jgi:hypothetical protein
LLLLNRFHENLVHVCSLFPETQLNPKQLSSIAAAGLVIPLFGWAWPHWRSAGAAT